MAYRNAQQATIEEAGEYDDADYEEYIEEDDEYVEDEDDEDDDESDEDEEEFDGQIEEGTQCEHSGLSSFTLTVGPTKTSAETGYILQLRKTVRRRKHNLCQIGLQAPNQVLYGCAQAYCKLSFDCLSFS